METAYFVAGPEAVALIAPAVEARLAYRERIHAISKRIGATGTMAYDGDQVAYWILSCGAAIPEGWKRAPRVRGVHGVVPDRKHAAGRAVWAEIGARPALPCRDLGARPTTILTDGAIIREGQQCMLSGGVVVRRRLREDPFVTLELAYSANGGLATLTVDVRRGSGEQSILCGLLARSDRWRLTQEAYLETLIWRTDPAGHRRGAL